MSDWLKLTLWLPAEDVACVPDALLLESLDESRSNGLELVLLVLLLSS
jgi:hypothetical protein